MPNPDVKYEIGSSTFDNSPVIFPTTTWKDFGTRKSTPAIDVHKSG